MQLTFSPRVKSDLEQIADYIARDSPMNSANLIRLLRSRFEDIRNQPLLYRLRPELAADARLVSAGRYIILFRVRNNTVRIERVVHGSRDLLALLGKSEQ